MRLKDKVAFISGGARGLGAAMATLFAREGATVVIGDVLEEEGRQTETEINETGGECLFVRLDVTNEAEWQQAVASTVARFGKLNVLVNNAGTCRFARVEEITNEQWDRDLDINAKGAFLGTKHAIPEMRKAGGGSMINIASVAALAGNIGTSCTYNMSQGRGAAIDQVHRCSIRQGRDPRQLHTSGQHRNNDDRPLFGGGGISTGPVQQYSPGPRGPAGRRGLRRPCTWLRTSPLLSPAAIWSLTVEQPQGGDKWFPCFAWEPEN